MPSTGVPEEEEKEGRYQVEFKDIIAEKFLNLAKYISLQIQKAKGIPDKIHPRNLSKCFVCIEKKLAPIHDFRKLPGK